MRIRIFTRVLYAGFIFLVTGLIYVQIIRHREFKVMSEENRLRVTPLMAPRGTIFDHGGNAIVKDVLSFNTCVIYRQINKHDSLVSVLSDISGLSSGVIKERIRKSREMPYSPAVIISDIGMEKAIQLEEIKADYPGLIVEVATKRVYGAPEATANIVGHLGLMNRSEYDKLKHYGYSINDRVGKDGIEKVYDNYLKGTHGGKQVEVDSRGREITVLGYKEAACGMDLYLTIDLALQKFCYSLLENRRGVIIAIDPSSGAILAMASAPSYDPGVFMAPNGASAVKSILGRGDSPLVNRAVSGEYPPGSVFKPVVAAGALESGKITAGTTFACAGSLELGNHLFRCWNDKGHGEQTITEAIKNSCNVFFYKAGLILGIDGIAATAQKFGFGEKTGTDIPSENAGTLPSREWKKKRFDDTWYKGETVNYAIGQGYLLVTPIQVARMMSVFANNGYLVTPHLGEKIENVPMTSDKKTALGLSDRTLEIVRDGLRKCVNDPHGTGTKAKLTELTVAGKTGTAQTSKNKKNHGWFAGFAPFEDPRLVVVVLDEYGGKGGYYAAGTAGEVFKKAHELGLV